MKEILDVLYDMQMQPSVSSDESDVNTNKFLHRKDTAESKFSQFLQKDQEVLFDNFMNTIDECNDSLQRLAYKKGFAMGMSIMKEAMNYSQITIDDPVKRLLEKMQ